MPKYEKMNVWISKNTLRNFIRFLPAPPTYRSSRFNSSVLYHRNFKNFLIRKTLKNMKTLTTP